jgi:uncharacterized coiled-coil protein SlyX
VPGGLTMIEFWNQMDKARDKLLEMTKKLEDI